MENRFAQKLSYLSRAENLPSILGIRRGVERETLRINKNGTISQKSHPESLGSALTHPHITTDFAEALLEFITPPELDANKTMAQLLDIHKFVQGNIGDEQLWSLSMPCYIKDESSIRIAEYGSSNIGRMKNLYRQGLKFRYGSMMQAISGVHFNFSIPDSLWQALAAEKGVEPTQDFISEQYLGLIRNFKRYVWLITWLFGASPTLCRSFVKGNESVLPFEKLGEGTLYLPHATSLRMSDLGYTNNEQSELKVMYNSLAEYVAGLRKAIRTPSEAFMKVGTCTEGEKCQLNGNILQIENEFYSPVRPKRTTASGEKPTDALDDRGIEYIEVRALDVNPFSPVGISLDQIHFLDVFLCWCLLHDSPELNWEQQKETEDNLDNVILHGRDPSLTLKRDGKEIGMTAWATTAFAQMKEIASWLDDAHGTTHYKATVKHWSTATTDMSVTLSARLLSLVKDAHEHSDGDWALKQAETYKAEFVAGDYKHIEQQCFVDLARESLEQQKTIEASDTLDFDAFLADYFADVVSS